MNSPASTASEAECKRLFDNIMNGIVIVEVLYDAKGQNCARPRQ